MYRLTRASRIACYLLTFGRRAACTKKEEPFACSMAAYVLNVHYLTERLRTSSGAQMRSESMRIYLWSAYQKVNRLSQQELQKALLGEEPSCFVFQDMINTEPEP